MKVYETALRGHVLFTVCLIVPHKDDMDTLETFCTYNDLNEAYQRARAEAQRHPGRAVVVVRSERSFCTERAYVHLPVEEGGV